jgi:serpin B
MSNKRQLRLIAAGVALGATLAACGAGHEVAEAPSAALPSATPTASPTGSVTPTASAMPAGPVHRLAPGADAPTAETVAGLERFAAAFYDVAAEKNKNFVFSPLSVAYAFAMLQEGAKGETKTQIDKAFGFPDGVAEAVNALTKGLVTSTAPPQATPKPVNGQNPPAAKPVLTIANAMFTQSGYPFEQAFLKTLGQQYGSTMQSTNFGDTDAAVAAINHWADVHTAGRIKEIFKSLDPTTRLVLANAVYLKASWTRPFEERAAQDFATPAGALTVPMMGLDQVLGYANGTGWQSVTLPYFGSRLAMRVILPSGSTTPAELMKPAVLDAAAATKPADVVVTMPKWDFSTDLDLVQLLKKLGITDVFGPADLSGITTAEALFVDQALHKANITVDELGTTASAVTAISVREMSGRATTTPPIVFTVDRPFVFEIVDTKTGAPLFTGSVANPTAK